MVLYVQLLKALYGCLRSALLFYRKPLDELEYRGFILNPYDPCVVNKMIGGKEFTITWHVDNLNISHVDKKVVDKMIKWMKGLYVQDMWIYIGKNHDYLGMIIDFSVRGKVSVTMVDYLKGIIPILRRWKHSPGPLHHQPRSTSTLLERKATKRNWMRNGPRHSIMMSHKCYLRAQGRKSISKLQFIS